LKIVWLKGDYTGKNKERQRQAEKEKCDIVIEFHFNSAGDRAASGTEVWHRQYSIPLGTWHQFCTIELLLSDSNLVA